MSSPIDTAWYELFSRGAHDWLRHNSKVREAVRAHLPELIAGPDLLSDPRQRTVQVPLRLLEHARFRLAQAHPERGAGQGDAAPGEVLRAAPDGAGEAAGQSGAGNDEGEVKLMLEFSIDDILDWIWDELNLPALQPHSGGNIEQVDLVREGIDKRGARSRLDRRRTVKEAIKRRAVQSNPVPFTNDDLRFHQLVARPRPSTSAIVFFAIDVSASMRDVERHLAKSFFFFALQGIRRHYAKVAVRFIAHTTHAWEFPESEFFQVSGIGGTIASSAFRLVLEQSSKALQVGRQNLYLFYASDGENFTEDHHAARAALGALGELLNYIAYVETLPGAPRSAETAMRRLCGELARDGLPIASSVLANPDDVWLALRQFFLNDAHGAERSP